MDRARPT